MNPWKYFLRNNIFPHVEDSNTAMCFFFARCVFRFPDCTPVAGFIRGRAPDSRGSSFSFSENGVFYTKIKDFLVKLIISSQNCILRRLAANPL